MSCCQNNLYNSTFDRKRAQEELANYRANGPKENSLPLINMLKKLELKNASVLDIGSGVGAVILELFDQGISHATYNDFSTAYSEAFQEEVSNKAVDKQVEFHLGDFLEEHQKIEQADLVTLDKVICCYKNYEGLVSISAQKAKKWYAYSAPRDVWWVRFVYFLKQKIRWIENNPFRSYVHPIQKIENILSKNDFKKIRSTSNWEWETVVYEKVKVEG